MEFPAAAQADVADHFPVQDVIRIQFARPRQAALPQAFGSAALEADKRHADRPALVAARIDARGIREGFQNGLEIIAAIERRAEIAPGTFEDGIKILQQFVAT